MKQIILIFLSLIFVTCADEKSTTEKFTAPLEKDIVDITKIIIEQDFIPNGVKPDSELKKLNVIFKKDYWPTKEEVLFIKLSKVFPNNLNNTELKNYMVFQNNDKRVFKISDENLSKINVTPDNPFNINTISIPIFNVNRDFAYVEVTHYMKPPGFDTGSGGCDYYILQRINGIWKITDNNLVWIT